MFYPNLPCPYLLRHPLLCTHLRVYHCSMPHLSYHNPALSISPCFLPLYSLLLPTLHWFTATPPQPLTSTVPSVLFLLRQAGVRRRDQITSQQYVLIKRWHSLKKGMGKGICLQGWPFSINLEDLLSSQYACLQLYQTEVSHGCVTQSAQDNAGRLPFVAECTPRIGVIPLFMLQCTVDCW